MKDERLRLWRDPCDIAGCDQERIARSGRGRPAKYCDLHSGMRNVIMDNCFACGAQITRQGSARLRAYRVKRRYCSSECRETQRSPFGRHKAPDEWREVTACMICGRGRPLVIDHDHGCCPGNLSCGRCVRGMLCMHCNIGIGNLGDDPDRLEAAARYLRRA